MCNRLQRTLTYRVLRVASLASLADNKVQLQNCLDIYKAQGRCTFVVSVVLLRVGVEKRMWSISSFYNRGD